MNFWRAIRQLVRFWRVAKLPARPAVLSPGHRSLGDEVKRLRKAQLTRRHGRRAVPPHPLRKGTHHG
jgi:hypothetical protein